MMHHASQEPGVQKRRILVAVPALNEEATIVSVIEAIPGRLADVVDVRVLVIDDGSEDSTSRAAKMAGASVVRLSETRGVGGAFQVALKYGLDNDFDIMATIDADGQMDPTYLSRLVQPILDGRADFTTASRFKDPALTPRMPLTKLWGNRMMSRLVSRLAERKFFDVSCGMRAYSREAARHLNLLGSFTYTQEVLLNLASKRLRIKEVPVPIRGVREVGESRVAKSLLRYAWQSSVILVRTYRDHRPLRFFGTIAGGLTLGAGALSGFLALHYLRTGNLTPHKWAGAAAASLFLFGVLFLFAGLMGDMLNRHRIYLEELLYESRARSGSQKRGRS